MVKKIGEGSNLKQYRCTRCRKYTLHKYIDGKIICQECKLISLVKNEI